MPAQLPDKILQWLYRVLQPEYANVVLCYQDVSLVMTCYPWLKVCTAVYTDEQGTSGLLVKLFGTLQQVGMDLWIPHEYPRKPPVVYLKSAVEGCSLAPNNYIDASGRFYHPFLSQWTQRYGNDVSNTGIPPQQNRLLGLMQALVNCLESHPPRVQEAATEVPQGPQVPPTLPQRPQSPPLPQKPDLGRPTQNMSSLPKAGGDNAEYDLAPRLSRVSIQTRQEMQPAQQQPTQPAAVSRKPAPLIPAHPSNMQLVESIKAALNDTAKLQLADELPSSEITALQNRLLQMNEADLNADHYLDYIEQKVGQNSAIVKQRLLAAQNLNDYLDTQISEVVPHIDEYLIAGTAVYNQLYTLVTSVEAISDLQYHLGKLHEEGKLELDRYIRTMRTLAREQCLQKQHVEKLAGICGLDNPSQGPC